MGGDACVIGSWPSAGAAAPRVKPPANVAPLFRSSRRLTRFEPIGLSFADQPKREIAFPKSKVYFVQAALSSSGTTCTAASRTALRNLSIVDPRQMTSHRDR